LKIESEVPMKPSEVAELMGEKQLAPGVHGSLFDDPNGIYVPTISADVPGSGDVGRYLDNLPRNRRIIFPNVLSAVLRGMLLRRGFIETTEYAEEFDETVEIMERKPCS